MLVETRRAYLRSTVTFLHGRGDVEIDFAPSVKGLPEHYFFVSYFAPEILSSYSLVGRPPPDWLLAHMVGGLHALSWSLQREDTQLARWVIEKYLAPSKAEAPSLSSFIPQPGFSLEKFAVQMERIAVCASPAISEDHAMNFVRAFNGLTALQSAVLSLLKGDFLRAARLLRWTPLLNLDAFTNDHVVTFKKLITHLRDWLVDAPEVQLNLVMAEMIYDKQVSPFRKKH